MVLLNLSPTLVERQFITNRVRTSRSYLVCVLIYIDNLSFSNASRCWTPIYYIPPSFFSRLMCQFLMYLNLVGVVMLLIISTLSLYLI